MEKKDQRVSAQINRPKIEDVLNDQVLRQSFTEFLQSTHCAENLLFYDVAQEYLTIQDPNIRKGAYDRIMADFFTNGSVHEVDISDAQLQDLRLYSTHPEVRTFWRIQSDVLLMLSFDCLPRFLLSENYLSLHEEPSSRSPTTIRQLFIKREPKSPTKDLRRTYQNKLLVNLKKNLTSSVR
eukprot:TRINITY_DN10753_c0_g1_i1.p2 TRINITY_DN10753_c0_g1~~TRINITY_DN10753_c0_g1_i1.p2  ORF type:complete len:181 (+),score=38.25 TRINITY_DN10753_c0_g1_i1:129-671(+)